MPPATNTPGSLKLRDYQEAAVEAIFRYFENETGHPLVAMPTGSGKALVISEFVKRAYQSFPGQRILMLTHVKELIEQNYKHLIRQWPTAPAGIYSAGLGRKDTCFPITFAGVASAANVPESFGRIDLILIDEAHLLGPKDDSMYRRLIYTLRNSNPSIKVIGFTATPFRLGQGMLTEGEGLFTDICFDMTGIEPFNWLIAQGYLVPLIPKKTQTELDVENVKVHAGEYVQKDLQEHVDKYEVTQAALYETIALGRDRKHWLIFASGIEHATHIKEQLELMGVPAGVLHSKLGDDHRTKVLADFRAGKIRAIVNNNILTTGFDFPGIDMIVMLRPTQSPVLWVQMLGRGTRCVYAPGHDLGTQDGRRLAIAGGGKGNCLVLDFAGNTRRLGPINDPIPPRRKGEGAKGKAPVRLCDACGCYSHASARICQWCGAEFKIAVKITNSASTSELIAQAGPVVETIPVHRTAYQLHKKPGRPPSIRVSYFCGLRMFSEWVCLEHIGYPGKRARDFWRERSGGRLPPDTTDEALKRLGELKPPKAIRVWTNKDPQEVMSAVL